MSILSKVLRKAAPIALPILGTMIPGVGNIAGAAFGGALAGATKKGGNALKNAAGGAAGGAITGATMGAAGGAGGGGGGLLSKIFSRGAGGAGGFSAGDLAQLGLGAYGAVQGAKQQKAGGKLQQRAIDLAMADYTAGAPLRDRARALAMQAPPARPDLSALFRGPNPLA